jgi:excisionase family DNA binding protein
MARRATVKDAGTKQMKTSMKGVDSSAASGDRKAAVKEFYTVSQLADLLQLTEMTIYRMVNRGELPCYAFGRMKRFRVGDVEDFLESHRQPAHASGTTRPAPRSRLKSRK